MDKSNKKCQKYQKRKPSSQTVTAGGYCYSFSFRVRDAPQLPYNWDENYRAGVQFNNSVLMLAQNRGFLVAKHLKLTNNSGKAASERSVRGEKKSTLVNHCQFLSARSLVNFAPHQLDKGSNLGGSLRLFRGETKSKSAVPSFVLPVFLLAWVR